MRIKLLFALVAVLAVGAFSSVASAATRANVIVVFKDSVTSPQTVAGQHVNRLGVDIKFVYRHALKGYAASVPSASVAVLRADTRSNTANNHLLFTNF